MSGPAPIKMLSIDDRTLTTDLDRHGYRKMGVIVKAASTYESALKILKSETIDLIVINMDYDKISANDICHHLKTQEAFKEIPAVLTSVQTSARIRKSAINAGADLFVEQPLPRQYFIEKLKQLLEQKTRMHNRLNIHGDVTYTIDGTTETCQIGDLSTSGILLSTEEIFKTGVQVTLNFSLPGYKKPIEVEGEVVRTLKYAPNHPDRQTGVGIRFIDFKGDSEKRLEKYITKSENRDSKMLYYL